MSYNILSQSKFFLILKHTLTKSSEFLFLFNFEFNYIYPRMATAYAINYRNCVTTTAMEYKPFKLDQFLLENRFFTPFFHSSPYKMYSNWKKIYWKTEKLSSQQFLWEQSFSIFLKKVTKKIHTWKNTQKNCQMFKKLKLK